jgi:putative tryptophan/tyrosine transport system substrate-binding protein
MKLPRIGVALAALFVSVLGPVHAQDQKQILGIFYEGCEKTCEGFKAGIANSGFAADVEVLDINQDKSRLPEAVKRVRETKPDLVVVYGTTATLGTIGTLDEAGDPRFIGDTPVVFTAVADPIGSHVVESFQRSGRANVTGTFNRVPEKLNIQIIRRYDPKFDKLGLLYNSNEKNSVQKMKELSELAPKMGVELVALDVDPGNSGTPKPELIPLRLRELREKGVKWLYLGSSSFLNANGELFTASAVENGIAVVSPYPALVREHQALLSIAAPREEVGKLAADQALRILSDGASPGDLPISVATHFTHVVNMKVAQKLGLLPPKAFNKDTEFVQEYYLSAPASN